MSFVKEPRWEELMYYLHMISSTKQSCVFTFRIVEGRVTSSTLEEVIRWVRRLGLMESNTHKETVHA